MGAVTSSSDTVLHVSISSPRSAGTDKNAVHAMWFGESSPFYATSVARYLKCMRCGIVFLVVRRTHER